MKTQTSKTRILLLGAALVAIVASPLARADYSNTLVSQGPVGYWRLSETTASPPPITTAANAGSMAATGNGTYDGSQGFLRGFAGALASSDKAVHFDGSSQDVQVPYNATLNPTANFTVEGWFKADSANAQCAISCGHFASPRSGWLIYQNGANSYNLRMYNQNGTATSLNLNGFVTNVASVVGVWTHVSFTYDGTTAIMYLNGSFAAQGNPTSYVPGPDGAFAIGMRSDTGFRWPGYADEVAFYPSVLSAAEIATHYGAASTNAAGYAALVAAKSPLLYFRLNEAGNTATENVGTLGAAGNGEFTSGSVPGQAGPAAPTFPGLAAPNYAVGFIGSGQGSVALPALKLDTNTVTISGWVRANGGQATSAGLVVAGSGADACGLTMDPIYPGLGLGYIWNGLTYGLSPSVDLGLPALPDSQWAFVALVIQPTEADIYLCDANNFANFTSVTNSFGVTHANQAFASATLVGTAASYTTRDFNGLIDEVAIFNRALSAGELYSQYAAAVGGVPPRIFVDLQGPTLPVAVGDPIVLTVDAGGTPALSYAWHKNGGLIATTSTGVFTIPSASLTDTGNYDVTVSNGSGSAPSQVLAVSVVTPVTPAISELVGFQNRTLYPGGTLSLSVVATGGGLKYQWYKGAAAIGSATASTFTITRVATGDSGSYSVTITNSAGTVSGGPVTITVAAPANNYETAIVNDLPEAWYRLNETGGTTMFDSLGRHDGVYTNITGGGSAVLTFGAAGAVAGSADTAVTLTPANSTCGVVPFSSKLNAAQFTLECWVKTTDTTTEMCPVSSHSSVPQGCWLRTYPAGSWSGGVSQGGSSFYVPSATAADGIVAGEWKHVVMVYDTSLKMYINGQWDGVGYVNFDRNASAPFIIGGLGGAAGFAPLFNGQVDEVLVYTNGLTLAQVQNHYSLAKFPTLVKPYFLVQPSSQEVVNNPLATVTLTGAADGPIPIAYQWFKNNSPIAGATTTTLSLNCDYTNAASYYLRATNSVGATNSSTALITMIPNNPAFVNVTNGLVLHLKFDGNLNDSSGRGNNGTAVLNGPAQAPSFVPGRLGANALFFYTSNSIPAVSYVTLGTPPDLNFGTSTDLSVSYWAKYQPGQTNGDLPFLGSAINSYGNAGFTFAPSYNQGGWSYSLNGACQVYGGANTINNGNWHHVLTTVNRTGSATTYLDGVQVDSRPANTIGNMDTGNAVNIGQDPTGIYSEDGSATLDDLAVWRRCLSPAEAYSVYYAATNSNSSFDVPGAVSLTITPSGSNLNINWNPGATLGTLWQATSLDGPWTKVNTYTPTYTVTPSGTATFFKLGMIE
jgi:hypothetical protein